MCVGVWDTLEWIQTRCGPANSLGLRSGSCRAACAQPDNKGFSTLLWGRSTRTSVLTHTATHSFYTETYRWCTHSSWQTSQFLKWVSGSSSRSDLFRRKSYTLSSCRARTPISYSSSSLCLNSFLPLTLSCHISTHIDCFPLALSVSLPPPDMHLTAVYSLLSFPLTSALFSLSPPAFKPSLCPAKWVMFWALGAISFNSNNPNATKRRGPGF